MITRFEPEKAGLLLLKFDEFTGDLRWTAPKRFQLFNQPMEVKWGSRSRLRTLRDDFRFGVSRVLMSRGFIELAKMVYMATYVNGQDLC